MWHSGFADSAFLAIRVLAGKRVESQQNWVRFGHVFFTRKHGFLLQWSTVLKKKCVVASSDTFMVELENLVSDLSYVQYITRTHTHTKATL